MLCISSAWKRCKNYDDYDLAVDAALGYTVLADQHFLVSQSVAEADGNVTGQVAYSPITSWCWMNSQGSQQLL